MTKLFLCSSVVLPLVCSLHASEGIVSSDLDTLFEQSTEVLSESKLNVDYTPSVVSVLHHGELRALGVKTLFDALALLPGIETSVTHNGYKKVTIRRMTQPNNYTFEKLKLLIDGSSIDAAVYGNSHYYFDLPVDLIKRIEVLRGPGSSLYGTGAFTGVISVTTYNEDRYAQNRVFGSIGSDMYRLAGTAISAAIDEQTHLWADGYYQSDKTRIDADDSFIYSNGLFDMQNGTFGTFPRAYEAVGDTKDLSLGLKLSHKNFLFDTRYKYSKDGNLFGWDEYLEPGVDGRLENRHLFSRLRYDTALNRHDTLHAEAGYVYYKMHNALQPYLHVSENEPPFYLPVTARIPYDASIGESESTWYGAVEYSTVRYESHALKGGIEARFTDLKESHVYDRLGGTSLYGYRELLAGGLQRDVYSVYVNDTVTISEHINALMSLRYDYYSDQSKGYLSAQAGAIYDADAWRFKLNYGHAYRVPTWVDLYTKAYGENDGVRHGNADLDAEIIDTVDFIMLYEYSSSHNYKATLYYSKAQDTIDINDDNPTEELLGYINLGAREVYGIEVEYDYTPGVKSRLHANVSYSRCNYVSPEDGHKVMESPDTAEIMVKGHYLYYLSPQMSLGSVVQYIGPRARQEYNRGWSDSDLKAYTTVDLTYAFTSGDQWKLYASLKNLFDADVRYASYYGQHNGIPGIGRNWLIQLEKSF